MIDGSNTKSWRLVYMTELQTGDVVCTVKQFKAARNTQELRESLFVVDKVQYSDTSRYRYRVMMRAGHVVHWYSNDSYKEIMRYEASEEEYLLTALTDCPVMLK